MRRRGPIRGVGRRTIAASCALLGLAASAVAGGLNFNWNTSQQCPTVQTYNWNFGCDANDAVMYMVAEVQPNIHLPGFNALEARIDVQSWGSIPAWWQAFNAGSCRETAFTAGVIDTLPTAPCAGTAITKLWTTQVHGGMGAWIYDSSTRLRFVLGFATAANRANNLSTVMRYNAFHVAVRTTNTVYVAPNPSQGIDEVLACDGCCQGMVITLTQVGLYGSGGAEDQLWMPIYTPYGLNGTEIAYQYGSPTGVCNVPVRNTTWGQLKGMYR